MIDIHTHILAGFDEGAQTLEESIEMCKIAAGDGVTAIAATPHTLNGIYVNERERIEAAVYALNQSLRAERIALTVYAGSEIHLTHDVIAHYKAGVLASLNRTNYLLVELPFSQCLATAEEIIFGLQLEGASVILAHPERYVYWWTDISILERLRDRDVMMQITAGSIIGIFGSQAQQASFRLIKEEIAAVAASDCHDFEKRLPKLSSAYGIVRERFCVKTADQLFIHNPARVLGINP